MADEEKPNNPAADAPAQTTAPTVTWDDSNMSTSYANVVNVASTREELTLFFGTNQTWNVRDSKGVTVQLTDRIVLNPYAAKRLWTLLGNVLREYENRYGALNLDVRDSGGGN
ncbi:MAG: DUF3467 domain-containing protein [Rhodospirillales bacterium]|nr:DUF3467 domain-containing protein [Rhodospirillales bacterium]